MPICWPRNWRRKGSTMADAALTLDAVLAQWRGLSSGDRKAIRKRLPLERRIALDQALTAETAPQHSHAQGKHQEFAAYSPWLAEIVAGCERDEAHPDGPPQAVRDAIRAAHAELAIQPDEAGPASLLDLARNALRQWGLWP